MLIPLRRRDGTLRAHTIVDPEDFERFGHLRWCLSGNGYPNRGVGPRAARSAVLLHREILGLTAGDPRTCDHINGDRLDNRRANLRIVTQRQNNQNRLAHGDSTSRLRGVCWDKRAGKWMARVQVDGRQAFLGYFDDETAAGNAAAAFRAEHMPYSARE